MLDPWAVLLAIIGIGLALLRLFVAAYPKPRPRFARWSLAGAIVCFLIAGEMWVCRFLLGDCAGRLPIVLAVGGAAVVALVGLSREIAQFRRDKRVAKENPEEESRRADRIRTVARRLCELQKDLGRLCEQAEKDGLEEPLRVWKSRVKRYLDANIASDKVTPFHELATEERSGQPRGHIQSSCDAHRHFLKELQHDVEAGYEPVKQEAVPSGRGVPSSKSFIYRSR